MFFAVTNRVNVDKSILFNLKNLRKFTYKTNFLGVSYSRMLEFILFFNMLFLYVFFFFFIHFSFENYSLCLTFILVLHRKMHYKLSTDEKEQIAKAEREKRRKIRLLQVSFIILKNILRI